ncbi:hypothetical protein chiPu_0014665 [Chiloscyllium punctatum]|uniref:Uncharacterized protein n=1 Tax=Chiloscyllium punctatum TaxID=137246 RepID=A0A401T0K2_CHIPU|nr:hypothetical protein [Chiloscyllium punctatum]
MVLPRGSSHSHTRYTVLPAHRAFAKTRARLEGSERTRARSRRSGPLGSGSERTRARSRRSGPLGSGSVWVREDTAAFGWTREDSGAVQAFGRTRRRVRAAPGARW